MLIEIDVPEDTYAISVTALYHKETDDKMISRCFYVIDGVVTDEDGKNKVKPDRTEDKPCFALPAEQTPIISAQQSQSV